MRLSSQRGSVHLAPTVILRATQLPNAKMTLRARLGWGLSAIAVVLIVPLLLSLRSLENLYKTSRLLRDREFAASLVLGSFHERTDDARRAEDALLFIHDEKSAARMQPQTHRLVPV